MPRTLPAPEPGFYEGLEDGRIYEVRKAKSGNWYAILMGRDRRGKVTTRYVGHAVQLGEKIEL